jgi:ADP-dependent NAD(P)H-hydrate dehydratase / NAD(P)H-hydrate epimerase
MSMPCRITPSTAAWPLHDAATSRALEAAWLGQVPPGTLMARAGLALARLLRARWPHARRVRVWAGPGNNGGDGWVAAHRLHASGCEVEVLELPASARRPDDATRAREAALAAGVRALPFDPDASRTMPDVAVDALLGLGAQQAPTGLLARAIAAVAEDAAPTLAVDLPSGLHPDNGQVLGEQAVRATVTLSLLTLKPGCFTGQGRDHAGELWFDRLEGAAPRALPEAPAPSAWLLGPVAMPMREHASHKGRFGDVVVCGGAVSMAGAATLAAHAALAAGAGRVLVSWLQPAGAGRMGLRPEVMDLHDWPGRPRQELAAATTVVGCGGGDAVRAALPPLLAHAARVVVDADALNAVAGEPSLRAALRARSARGLPSLLTPHPLEAARLLGGTVAAVQADRLGAARRLAETTGATVVLKGSGTVVADAERRLAINPTGNGALATAGSGDVLAGWAGGLWACAPANGAFDIACCAVWAHGAAADRLQAGHRHPGPLRAADQIEALWRGLAASAAASDPG